MQKFIQYFIKHSLVTNWVMIIICVAGIFALFSMNKRVNPKYDVEEIEVEVPYPGASSVEVEEGIVIKIEEALRGLEGIDRVTSTSYDNWGTVHIEVDPDYDMNKALQNVKNSVNSINSYPTGAEKPIIYQNTSWNRAIMLSVYGPKDLLVLKKVVEEFRDDLLATGKITNINYWGVPSREICIEVTPEDLIRYKLTIQEISQAVRNSNLNISSGSVYTDQEEILIRSYEKKYEAPEFENIEVVSGINGQKILLKDICRITEKWPDNMFYSEYNGLPSVGFNVMYNNNEDVVEIVQITEDMAKKYQAKYDGLVNFKTFIKETDDLEERIDLMTQNGLLGLVLVLILLGIFLNARLAFWVAVGIPISLLGMFFVLWVLNITINEMSLFGVILVIGILVDDGIIIGESIYSQYEKYGKTPMRAAIDGTLDVIKPVSISVFTTMVAFVPYFYFYGGLGKFVWQIAAVIIISLSFSLVEAILILPAHIAHSKALHIPEKSNNIFTRIRESINKGIEFVTVKVYKRILNLSLEYRWSVSAVLVTVILVIIGLFMGSHVRAQFFPELEPPYARIQVEVPAGISADVADQIRNKLIDKSLQFAKTYEEKGLANPIVNYTSWMNGSTINIFFILPGAEKRDYTIGQFSDALSDYIGNVPEAENVMVGGWTFGGDPISVKFQSHDYAQLFKAKELLKEKLRDIAGVKSIQDDTPLGNNEFIVKLKPKGHALGFTMGDLTSQLRAGFYGQEVMRLQKGRDEVKVWVRFNKQDRISVSQIENLKVRTPNGEYVPFKEVADYTIERGFARIRHENGLRSVRVFAKFDYAKNDLAVVLKDLENEIVPSVLSQVENVTRSYGGQSEEMGKIQDSMVMSMTIAFIVMFSILIFLLKSYVQAGLIMSLIPLGIIGAVFGHYIIGIPVSILSFLGIVALAGIIINDSVVFIDRYNNLVREGIELKDALLEAGTSRFRPIILTTVTTAAGLAPIIFLRSEQGQFLVPMAVSVAFGLIFGTFLTLLALPSTILAVNDLRVLFNKLKHKIFKTKLKSRLELEPAYIDNQEML